MEDFDGLVGIVSQNNPLVEKLAEKFREKYLDVIIFDEKSFPKEKKFNYLLINFLDNSPDETFVKNILKNLSCKVLIIHPFYVPENKKYMTDAFLDELLFINSNAGILLVPELLGWGVVFNENFVTHDLIIQSLTSERIKIKNESVIINAVSTPKLIERIVVEMLSFGISGQKILLTGVRLTPISFAAKFLNISKNNLIIKEKKKELAEVSYTNSYFCDFSVSSVLEKTVNWFKENLQELKNVKDNSEILTPQDSKQKITFLKNKKFRFFSFKTIIKLMSFLIGLIAAPFLILIFGFFSLFMSVKYMVIDNNKAVLASDLAEKSFSIVSFLDFGIDGYSDTASLGNQLTEIIKETIYLGGITTNFITKILGDEDYQVINFTDSVSAGLDKLYLDISFFEADLSRLDGFLKKRIVKYMNQNKLDLAQIKSSVYNTKELVSRMADVLGNSNPRKYLVLFQNNMELRPTGGFIGSYSLLTFDKGKLTNMLVDDIYSADGQLKGYVEPPEPIKKYLGEAGWYLRDSNWDPDFNETSKTVQWFLDKEIGEKVDGVIGIDLFFVKKILEITGPIYLSDFNLTIDSDNLYTILQSEVQTDFFPGSIKKASFLTALARFLTLEIEKIDSKKYFSLISAVYQSLEKKHILLSLNDAFVQDFVSKLNYSGAIDLSIGCGLRCLISPYMVVDANLGVNKANFHLKRFQEVKITAAKNNIKHTLDLIYENSARSVVGREGIYKTYTRILVPPTASFLSLKVYDESENYQNLPFDQLQKKERQEIGFLIEVLPGSKKKIQIEWEIVTDVLNAGGELRIKSLKQPGTEGDDLSVVVEEKDLTLTGGVKKAYNTALNKDLVIKLFFK